VKVYAVADDPGQVTEADEANNLHAQSVMIPMVPAGNLDHDGNVDLGDFAAFAACLAGPDVVDPPDGCDPVTFAQCDLDGDLDVDLGDFGIFEVLFSSMP